jgi:PAS domain S-box-containing protein
MGLETTAAGFEAAMLQSAADAIVGRSPGDDIASWNAGAERLFGYAASEALGLRFETLIPERRRRFEREIADRLRSGEIVGRYDSERLTKDGRILEVSVSASPVFDSEGNVIGACEIARDVTLLRQKDAELQRLYSAARKMSATLDRQALCSAFRELAGDAVPCDGMVVSTFDPERGEIRCAYVWTGSLEMDPTSLPHIKYDPESGGMQTEVIRTGESRVFDVGERVSRPGGQYIEVERDGSQRDLKEETAAPPTPRSALMTPIKLDGRVLGVVQVMSHKLDAYGPRELAAFEALVSPLGIAFQNAELYDAAQREIAERRTAEEALRKSEERYRVLAEELEERVNHRTDALQKAVDELTGFSYSISHDMRGPIRAIISSSRVLLDDHGSDLNESAITELARQAAAAKKLGALVDDLLQYARLGHREPVRDQVDLSALARSVISRVSQPGWPCEDAEVEVEDGIVAYGDPALLEILLTILFENAGKYRRPGVTPKIRFGRQGERYFVADEGIGFEMKYVGKLFRPFERLHRDEEYPGTGIGLANARRIVERHGGRIWAESPGIGHGATFWFTL